MSTHTSHTYLPTIIDSQPLVPRLISELKTLEEQLQIAWPEFRAHPFKSAGSFCRSVVERVQQVLISPHVLAAIFIVITVVASVLLTESVLRKTLSNSIDQNDEVAELTMINLNDRKQPSNGKSIGRDGNARVGFNKGKGEGSGEVHQRSRGGGTGGDNDPLPPQTGEIPPPSPVLAEIPKAPPIHPPSLPAAGIDLDPALWKDLKAPVYGDPLSTSNAPSKGPGNGGGIGTNEGLGIGNGHGPGVGPGNDGNMGGDNRQIGCCGTSGGNSDSDAFDRSIVPGREVEQRARVIFKPEPQYTEDARRNQVTGTVMLKVVFSSVGQVEQIHAMRTLPFGLTEKAIAAARQIKFVPAMKGGQPVSIWMQLEYNFNLY